jgi:hypothetical protein
MLPIEFARASDSGVGRLTLVITPGATEVPVLWSELGYSTIDAAVAALVRREGTGRSGIGVWPVDARRELPGFTRIELWAREIGLDYAIWAALPPQFAGERGRPPVSAAEAIAYLEKRDTETFKKAEEYVRLAPEQIRTAFRSAFEARFGWWPKTDIAALDAGSEQV